MTTPAEAWATEAERMGRRLAELPADDALAIVKHLSSIIAPIYVEGFDSEFVLGELRAAGRNLATTWRDADDLRLVSYHEAGHAVTAIRLGYKVRAVSAQGNSLVAGWATLARIEPFAARSMEDRERIMHSIIVTLAGPVATAVLAESMFRSPSSEEWARHLAEARELAERIEGITDSEIGAYLLWLASKARGEVKKYWGDIVAIGEALAIHRSLSGDDVRRLLSEPDVMKVHADLFDARRDALECAA